MNNSGLKLREETYSQLVLINQVLSKSAENISAKTIDSVQDGSTISELFPDDNFAMYIRDRLGKISIDDVVTQDELDTILSITEYMAKIPLSDYQPIYSLEGISHLRNLHKLTFSAKNLNELPEELCDLELLEYFEMNYYQNNQLPAWFTDLRNLKWLEFGNTNLANLPSNMDVFTELQWLELWDTKIIHLPDSLSRITSLVGLVVHISKMSEIPEWIGNMLSLQSLQFSEAPVLSVPDSIGNLANLEYLDLHNTRIESIPENVGNLNKLKSLNLEYTFVTELPASVVALEIPELNIKHTGIK